MLYNLVVTNISNLQSKLNNTAHFETDKNGYLKLVIWLEAEHLAISFAVHKRTRNVEIFDR